MTDRVAVVTGGGRGIGRAIAGALSAQGRRVAVLDIREDEAQASATAIGEAGGTATAFAVDITDSDAVTEAFLAVTDELGPVDVLVNNAGWDELKPFLDTDEAFWDRIIDINYKGMLRTCREVLPGMIERRWGRIVNIGSDAGRVGSSLEAVYSGAKGGVIAFSKTLARETARTGVTVNVVCPGPTDTNLFAGFLEGAGNPEKLMEAFRRSVPVGRIGQPDDLPGAICFLSSDDAAFVTGQTISVSGGLTMAG